MLMPCHNAVDQQHERQCRPHRPVVTPNDLVVHGWRHHLEPGTSQQNRRGVGVHAQDEHESAARRNAWQREWQDNPPENHDWWRLSLSETQSG